MLNSNFDQQRVFVLGEDSLFEEGVTHLLADRTDYLVSKAKFSDELFFLDAIKQEAPDVIVVCESGLLDAERIIHLISSQLFMMALFIVVVRLRNNVIDIYEIPANVSEKMYFNSGRIVADSEEDLLNVLRREHHAQ